MLGALRAHLAPSTAPAPSHVPEMILAPAAPRPPCPSEPCPCHHPHRHHVLVSVCCRGGLCWVNPAAFGTLLLPPGGAQGRGAFAAGDPRRAAPHGNLTIAAKNNPGKGGVGGGLQKGTKFHMLCVHANPEGAAAKHQAHAKGSRAAASFSSTTGGQQQVGGEGLVSLVRGMLVP